MINMKIKTTKLIRKIAQFKLYLMRVSSYIALINFYMLFSIYFKGYGLLFKIVAFIGLIIGIIIVGYLDTKLKVFYEEQRKINNENPQILEILNELKKINGNN